MQIRNHANPYQGELEMTVRQRIAKSISKSMLAGLAFLAIALPSYAQVKTQTQVQKGAATRQVKVERGEVVYVSGNNLVVKAEDGTLRHFDNVPESVTVTVDGQQLNIHQLKVGMKLERQTVTTTVPKTITTIKTVSGTVFYVQAPNSVILTMANGKNQQFKIPKGQKFTINGQELDAFGLKKGMKVDAQQVIEVPITEVALQVNRSGSMPPPPPAPAADVPILIASAPAHDAAPAEADAPEPAPTKLPKTASNLPLVGLLGALSLILGLAIKAARSL
jgi:RNase P/RNase MRP subunit p29